MSRRFPIAVLLGCLIAVLHFQAICGLKTVPAPGAWPPGWRNWPATPIFFRITP